jgi:hypothetical protein
MTTSARMTASPPARADDAVASGRARAAKCRAGLGRLRCAKKTGTHEQPGKYAFYRTIGPASAPIKSCTWTGRSRPGERKGRVAARRRTRSRTMYRNPVASRKAVKSSTAAELSEGRRAVGNVGQVRGTEATLGQHRSSQYRSNVTDRSRDPRSIGSGTYAAPPVPLRFMRRDIFNRCRHRRHCRYDGQPGGTRYDEIAFRTTRGSLRGRVAAPVAQNILSCWRHARASAGHVLAARRAAPSRLTRCRGQRTLAGKDRARAWLVRRLCPVRNDKQQEKHRSGVPDRQQVARDHRLGQEKDYQRHHEIR